MNGVVRDNKKAGVLEPGMSKIKSFKFATEAAITILRIDTLIKLPVCCCCSCPHMSLMYGSPATTRTPIVTRTPWQAAAWMDRCDACVCVRGLRK